MSVAHLSAREFSTFVAIAAKLGLGKIDDLAEMAAMMSHSNSSAYTAQYNDPAESVTPADILPEAYRKLSEDDLSGNYGPIVYNCVTNEGQLYYGDLPADPAQIEVSRDIAEWRRIESACNEWSSARSREMERAEQNAEAFNDVGQLPVKSADELKALMGDGALIVAEYGVDQSDSQSDYHGGRTARTVVIGRRKSKRENFSALRKAAGLFPPTACYGLGKDDYTVRVVFTNDVTSNGQAYWKGTSSHWHNDIGHGKQFDTETEAQAFIDAAGQPHDLGMDGETGKFAWQIGRASYENRENYSMGGGNYLGTSRYGGWQVRSCTYLSNQMEVFSMAEISGSPPPVKKVDEDAPKGPFWTPKGILSDYPDSTYSKEFRKQETAVLTMAKLIRAGYVVELLHGRRSKNSLFIHKVSGPGDVPATTESEVKPIESAPVAETNEPLPDLTWLEFC